MLGLIVSNIVVLLLITGVTYYVFFTHNQLLDEIKNLKNFYSSSLDSVYGELSGTLAETEWDLYEKMVEQERAYYIQLMKQSDDLNFAFSNQASGISSSVSQIQQKINETTSQQEMLTKSIQSQQEMLTQSIQSQQAQQEMLTNTLLSQQGMLANSLLSQQEMITQTMLAQQAQQEMLFELQQQPQQEYYALQDFDDDQDWQTEDTTTQEIIPQEMPATQADDIVKRANLMAIAYYNAFRDKTPNEVLQWDKINKHLYIVGFTNYLYKSGSLQVPVFSEIVFMPYKGKYKVSDVVNFLIDYFAYYMPDSLNPDGLKLFELEKQMNNGETMTSLATTFGALPSDANFFPPSQDTTIGIPFGSKYLFNIKTENPTARSLLDKAIQTAM